MQSTYYGIDSYKYCKNTKHFKKYSKKVLYNNFNSRGFCDEEWGSKTKNLSTCIWCFSDSLLLD